MLAQDIANVIKILGIVCRDCCVALIRSRQGKLDSTIRKLDCPMF